MHHDTMVSTTVSWYQPWCHGGLVSRYHNTVVSQYQRHKRLLIQGNEALVEDATLATEVIIVDEIVDRDAGNLIFTGTNTSGFIVKHQLGNRLFFSLGEAVSRCLLAELFDCFAHHKKQVGCLRNIGITVSWCRDTVVAWYRGIVVAWYRGITIPWCHTIRWDV